MRKINVFSFFWMVKFLKMPQYLIILVLKTKEAFSK